MTLCAIGLVLSGSVYFFGEMALFFFFAVYSALSVFSWVGLLALLVWRLGTGKTTMPVPVEEEARPGKRVARIGGDGLLLEDEFIPWSNVLAIENEAEGVAIIQREGAKRVCRFDDDLGFGEAARMAQADYHAVLEPPHVEPLEPRSESAEEREVRLANLKVASGYRDGAPDSIDPETLAELACNPRSDAKTRLEAAKILARVEPARLVQVRVAMEQTAEPVFARELADTLGEREAT